MAVGFIVGPLTAAAQQGVTGPRIGWLSIDASAASGERYLGRFRRGLTDLGYVEGKNIVIEVRSADGKSERLPALADELARAGVQVIVALEPPSMQAAARVTRTIPIVARFSEDPVDAHLVASFARPGGNLTGVTSISVELYGKRLELLKEAVPAISSIGVILDPQGPGTLVALRETQVAAKRLGIHVKLLEVKTARDLDHAFRQLRDWHVKAVIPLRNPLFVRDRQRLVTLANQSRLPAIYDERSFAEAGGLMTFGASLDDLNHRAAGYVDKILKGTKAADLPIERPTRFELVVNLKTAKALGMTIPPSLLVQATEVIQ